MTIDRKRMDILCEIGGRALNLPPDIDPVRFLKALATVETSYGQNCVPRYEKSYDWGGKNADTNLLSQYGDWAACSYGPFQVMFPNCARMLPGIDPVAMQLAPESGLLCAVHFINLEIIGRQKATTLEAIADAYNSGNWHDSFVPTQYVGKLVGAYGNFENTILT